MLMLAVTKHSSQKCLKKSLSCRRPLSLGGLIKLAMGLYCNLMPAQLYLFIPIQKLKVIEEAVKTSLKQAGQVLRMYLTSRSIEKCKPKRKKISKVEKLKQSNKINENIIFAKTLEAFNLKANLIRLTITINTCTTLERGLLAKNRKKIDLTNTLQLQKIKIAKVIIFRDIEHFKPTF